MHETALNRVRRRAAGTLVAFLVLLAVAVVAVPLWLIQAFKPQTPEGVELSYILRRGALVFTLAALVATLAIAAWLWRGARWWAKAALVLAVLPLAGAVWLARQNLFERMFTPAANVEHAAVDEASWMEEGDMVLGIELNGDAVAFPVDQVAYHHIVQDVVGGVPVAATY